MVLAHGAKKLIDNWFEKRERKLREEGMAKGRTEANQAWTAWNARREETEARGEPFTEPPPTPKP